MSKIDVAALLEPVSDDDPCGEDLEYDLAFTEMELASVGKEAQEMGDSVVEGEEPDWRDLAEKSTEVMQRSKDLRAAFYLTTAATHLDGLKGFVDGLELIHGMLERYWEHLHPLLDPDDDNDPTLRVNTISQLADNSMLRNLREVPLTDSRMLGRLGMRHVMIARGEMSLPEGSSETPPDMAGINGAFQDTDPDAVAATAEQIDLGLSHIEAINSQLSDHVGVASSVDFSALTKLFKDMKSVVASVTGEGGGEEGGLEMDAGAAGGGGGGGSAVAAAPGSINSANDVLNAIDRICDYYTRQEPSSPVPILLQRARRLVAADFLTIVKDMAPEGVRQVNLIGGIKENDGYSDDY